MFIYEKSFAHILVLIGEHDQNFENHFLKYPREEQQEAACDGEQKLGEIMEARRDYILIRKEAVHCPLYLGSWKITQSQSSTSYVPHARLAANEWWSITKKRLLLRLNIYKVAKGVICYTLPPHSATQVLFLC